MPKGTMWSYSDEAILIEKYSTCSIKELLEILPNRSRESINNKIKRLKSEKKLSGGKNKQHKDL